jgi:hypothetical protein
MHGYRRSQREVLDVVKVCEATLRRRMVEFVQTRSSSLTFSEFEAETEEQHRGGGGGGLGGGGGGPVVGSSKGLLDEDEGSNPPAFTRACAGEASALRAAQRRAEVIAQLEAKKITEEDVGRAWEAEVQLLLKSPSFKEINDRQPIHLHESSSQRKVIQQLIRQHMTGIGGGEEGEGEGEGVGGTEASLPSSEASPQPTEGSSSSPASVDAIDEGERLLASLKAIGAVIAGPSSASDDDGMAV